MNQLSPSSSVPASKALVSREAEKPGGVSLIPINSALPLPYRQTARSTSALPPNPPPLEIPFPRCSVKGCIFPAASAGGRLCLVHDLAEREPRHFLSVQPSSLCLDRAKYGIADSDYDDSRARDRRQLSIQLHRFRNEVA
jgi:hypothetical protein